MAGGEALRHSDGLGIGQLAGQPAAPLGVRELLPLGLELALGRDAAPPAWR